MGPDSNEVFFPMELTSVVKVAFKGIQIVYEGADSEGKCLGVRDVYPFFSAITSMTVCVLPGTEVRHFPKITGKEYRQA